MPRGRPPKLTPEMIGKLVSLIKEGNFIYVACRCVGVDVATFYDWMNKGKVQKSGIYRDLVEAMSLAEAELEDELVRTWKRQMPEDWHAVKEFLERRFQTRWNKSERVQVTGELNVNQKLGETAKALLNNPEARKLATQLYAIMLEGNVGGTVPDSQFGEEDIESGSPRGDK